MPRHHYHKLIRDRIPELLLAKGHECSLRRLGPAPYERALRKKIIEEAGELQQARGRDAVLNELVDLQELVDAFRRALHVPAKRFAGMARRKRIARGGFRKRLFLDHTEKARRRRHN